MMTTVFDFRVHGIVPDYEAVLPLLQKYGIRAVNASPALLDSPVQAMEMARRVVDAGLKWSTLPLSIPFYAEDTDDAQFTAGLERLRRWMALSPQMGIDAAYDYLSPGSNLRSYDEQFAFVVDRATQVATVMREGGLHYGFEFIGPTTSRVAFRYEFIHTLPEILKLNRAVGMNTGFVFDAFHWYCSGGSPDDLALASANINSVVTLHLEDAIPGIPPQQQVVEQREYPMASGIIPSDQVVRSFRDAGYEGVVMAEPFGQPIMLSIANGLDSAIRRLAECYQYSGAEV